MQWMSQPHPFRVCVWPLRISETEALRSPVYTVLVRRQDDAMDEHAGKLILLVEDEPVLAMSSRIQLERYGYRVTTAESGEKAINAVLENTGIDLVLMDIDLGGSMDGTITAETILGTHDLPILFVSSHEEPEIVAKTEKITSYGYVVKNSSITVLDASIKMAFKLFEAKKREEEKEALLQASEQKYRLISENTSDGIVHFNPVGRIDYVSPSYLIQLGSTEAEEIGKSLDAVLDDLHPDDHDTILSIIQSAIASHKNDITYTYRIRHRDGHYIWREDRSHYLYDQAGTFREAYVSCRDISDRKRMEFALEESKKRAEMLLGLAAEIIISSSFDGTILLLNESGHSILGYEYPELVGKNYYDIFLTPEVREEVRKYAYSLRDSNFQGKDTRQNEVVTRTGEYRTIRWHNTVLKDSDGTPVGIFSSGEDITKQIELESTLRTNLDRIRHIIDSLSEGIYGVDIEENCTFLNTSGLAMLGYSHESEVLGKNMHYLIHGKHADGTVYPLEDCPIAKAFLEGRGVHIDDEVFYRADGSFFHAEYWSSPQVSDGRLTGAVMSFIDITEQLKARKALQESENRFKKLAEFTFEGIIIHNNGIAIDINESVVRMLGFGREEIVGMNLFEVITPEYHQLVRDNIKKQVASPYRIVARRKDGSVFDAEIEARNIRFQGEDFRVACIRDITETKKTEDRIRSLLAEKELILKEVHHRIMNNLNTVSSLLSLEAGRSADSAAVTILNGARSKVESMAILYEKLYRTQAYIGTDGAEYIDAVIKSVVSNFPDSCVITLDTDIQAFALDVKRLQTMGIIVTELLTNTMKYAFRGRKHGHIYVTAVDREGVLSLSVRDDGIGIPDSVTFEHSTGFGMQLVAALAMQLDARLSIERGSGTTITVTIPLAG